MNNVSPARDNSGRASLWTPSPREVERQIARNAINRKKILIATTSSILVLGALASLIVTSPGWQVVKETFFDWSYGSEVLGAISKGLIVNVRLTIIAAILIGFFAMVLALLRTSRSAALTPFRFLATAYVDIFRGVPLLLVILLIGFGLPALRIQGLTNSVLILGTAAVVLTYSAYVAEVLRSGILSIHPSQRAAARSLGLTSSQTMRHVVLPQATYAE